MRNILFKNCGGGCNKTFNVIKNKGSLYKKSRFMEVKDTTQLNAIPETRLDYVLWG